MDILSSMDTNNNSTKKFVAEKVSSNPTTNLVEGRLIYNTKTKEYLYYNGTKWVNAASGYPSSSSVKTAVDNSHTHSNKTVLDGITSTKVSNWDTAYTNSQANTNSINNMQKSITIYVDAANGSDDNTGLSTSSRLKTFAKAIEVAGKSRLRCVISLYAGTYTIPNKKMTKIGSSISIRATSDISDPTLVTVKGNIAAVNASVNLSTLTLDCTDENYADINSAPVSSSSFGRFYLYKVIINTTHTYAINAQSDSNVVCDNCTFNSTGYAVYLYNASHGFIRNNCTSSSGQGVYSNTNSVAYISGCPDLSYANAYYGVVYVDGVRKLPNPEHSHDNKTVIDGITSTNVSNWNTAYTNSHTHSNKKVLDGITSAKVTNWNTAYTDSQANELEISRMITSVNVYVDAKNGSDSNNGTTSTTAYKTLEKALDVTKHAGFANITILGTAIWSNIPDKTLVLQNRRIKITGVNKTQQASVHGHVTMRNSCLVLDNIAFKCLNNDDADITSDAAIELISNSKVILVNNSYISALNNYAVSAKTGSYIYAYNTFLGGVNYGVLLSSGSQAYLNTCTITTKSSEESPKGVHCVNSSVAYLWDCTNTTSGQEFTYTAENDSMVFVDGRQVAPIVAHAHTNKTTLDGITSTKVSNWDTAATRSGILYTRNPIMVTVYVDATNGKDTNSGTSSSAPFKTLSAALERTKYSGMEYIILLDGTYDIPDKILSLRDRKIRIAKSSSATSVTIRGNFNLYNTYLNLSNITVDSTDSNYASASTAPIAPNYKSVIHLVGCTIKSATNYGIDARIDSEVYCDSTSFTGNTSYAVYISGGCTATLRNGCTVDSSATKGLLCSTGSKAYIFECDNFPYTSSNYGMVYVDGKEVYPIDLINVLEEVLGYRIKQRNLLHCDYYNDDGTNPETVQDGLTFRYHSGLGHILISGTASATTYYIFQQTLRLDPNTNYTLTGCPSGGSTTTYCMYLESSGGTQKVDKGSGVTFNTGSETTWTLKIKIQSGQSYTSKEFYPYLQYEILKGEEYLTYPQVEAYGKIVGGSNINNRLKNIITEIDKLKNAIISLGGNV